MDFNEATAELKAGEKIRRPTWAAGSYLKMTDNEIKSFVKEIKLFQYDLSILVSSEWVICGDPQLILSFPEAIKFLAMGFSVQMKDWDEGTYIKLSSDESEIWLYADAELIFIPCAHDFMAGDWEILR